jgi:uncharacterized protein YmfQ (DUF2313 family)
MSSSVPPAFPPPNQAPLPPGKKPNILIWILGGLVVVMIGITAMCGLGGYFLMRKAKNAGFDTELLSKNPAYAAAKMAATMSPDVETISSNDNNGTMVVRDKKTGKTMTLKFDPDKKTMVVTDENGQEAKISVSGDGDKGVLEVQSQDGTMKFGSSASNQMPAWVPVYPGSSPQGTFSSQTKEGDQRTFAFKTKDAPAKVMSYYQDQLKSAGFSITLTTSGEQGGMVMAEDGGKTRTLMLTTSGSGDGTDVSVTAIDKK